MRVFSYQDGSELDSRDVPESLAMFLANVPFSPITKEQLHTYTSMAPVSSSPELRIGRSTALACKGLTRIRGTYMYFCMGICAQLLARGEGPQSLPRLPP